MKNHATTDIRNRIKRGSNTCHPSKTQCSTRTLTDKLEEKLSHIEKDLKESVELLECEVHHLCQAKTGQSSSKDLKAELTLLAKTLEARINKTMTILEKRSQAGFKKNEQQFVGSLAKKLVGVLSFEFYKTVMHRALKINPCREVDAFGKDPLWAEKIKPVFDFLYHRYWRIETTGIENVPKKGRALLVGNHSGTVPYDGAMIATAIANEHPVRDDARFLVEDFVFHMPMLGMFMYKIGGVRACPENAQRLLSEENLVIVFPEGVKGIGKYFNERYKLQRFGRGGFVKLCMATKSPLIPVAIVGAEEIHPIVFKSNILAKSIGLPYIPITPTFPFLGPLGAFPLPTKWQIHFGKPIFFDAYTSEDHEDELKIHKLSETVRAQIQNLLKELLKQRRSIWWG